MSDDTQNLELDEKTLLKERATTLGIKFGNNISVETLRQKVEEHLAGVQSAPVVAPVEEPKELTPIQLRQKLIKDATRLVRIRIACMNPQKKQLLGEFVTVGNKYIGTVRKFIPYGPEHSVNGYHVPYCIYEFLKSKTFLEIKTTKVRGVPHHTTRDMPEFAIEVLPPLTQSEIKRLAVQQAAAAGNAEES